MPSIDLEVGEIAQDVAEQVADIVATAKTQQLLQESAEAEEGRVAAEQGRVSAEQARATEFAGFEDEIDSKITYGSKWFDGSGGVAYADNADQLNSPDFTTDQAPYLYRTSGGDADIGNREKDTIVGGSLGWNQLIKNGNFVNADNWAGSITASEFSVSDNVLTITPQESGDKYLQTSVTPISGHRYLYMLTANSDTANTAVGMLFIGTVLNYASLTCVSAGSWETLGTIFTAVEGTIGIARLRSPVGGSSVRFKNVMLFDLTACFGPTIADYIYSLEQATAGAGVAWFRKYFPKAYYPYKAIGDFLHVKLISHDMVHFNQWDEVAVAFGSNGISSNTFDVLPNTTYFFKGPQNKYVSCYFRDINGNNISEGAFVTNTTFTTPANCRKFLFIIEQYGSTTYKGDITINLSWSGWRNGQYEAYKKNSYPLDTSVILRGIPKLDADNNLYYDGDRYEYTGKVTRKYGIVDLGTLSWAYYSSDQIFYTTKQGFKPKGDILCSKYRRTTGAFNNMPDNTISSNNQSFGTAAYIFIKDTNYTDAETFKAALSGVYLIYELAEPTEETADLFQETQEVDDFGTEEYVVPEQDGVQIPVGHYTEYPENLRDKLRRLPNMPTVSESTTATYVVNYNGQTKKCSFVPINDWLVANGYPAVQDLSDQITDVAGLTYSVKKAYKIGNVVTLTVLAQNNTGSQISANSTLFTVGSGLTPNVNVIIAAMNGITASRGQIASNGNVNCYTAIPNGDGIYFVVSYAVA